jgi:hypothetical protein
MKPPKIINGVLHSPYFIFIRAVGSLSDIEVLNLLGLGEFVLVPLVSDWSKPHIYLTEDHNWIHVADDWRYSLWHKGRHQLVENLHRSIPEVSIFACSVGDSDHSFEFAYYSTGRLLRHHTVEDKLYDKQKRVVTENFGEPLPGERKLTDIQDEQEYVLALASGLGVKMNHDLASIRCYAKSDGRIESKAV